MNIDQIIRTPRKTFAILVEHDGRVIVRAPLRATIAQIQAIVDQKAAWIKARQEMFRAANPQPAPKEFVEGEEFLYLGQAYPLVLVNRQDSPLVLNGRFSLDRRFLPRARQVFVAWYRRQARSVLAARVETLASQYGFRTREVKITSAQKRWGSCSQSGSLNFSWRLVMAPLSVIDYVVVHELAHLREKNHSRRYWALVENLMPDYKERRAWLKKNGIFLSLD